VTTVSNTPEPPKAVTPKAAPPERHDYGRPPSGGPPVAGKSEGNPPGGDAPPGIVPGMDAYRLNLAGNAFPNPMIDGAKIVAVTAQPDATGHPAADTSGGGTVGDSGNQGAGPGGMPGA
jgi:hypothetical protein